MAATDQPDTEELLDRASQGDDSATQQLLARHRSRLRKMVGVRLDPRLAARLDPSDVVQETLIEAARQLPKYLENRPIAFYPWLRRIALNRLDKLHTKHIGTKSRSVDREEVPHLMLSDASVLRLARRLILDGTSPSGQMLREELRQWVRAALLKLDEIDREVLVLRFLEQLSTKEIAVTLGIAEGAVRVRQLRALRRLQFLLGHNEDYEEDGDS
jgi:RNA polymerase sigma-70 factor (ECF subfamily)